MKHLDEKLRRMAREEDTPVPDGFDERLAARLAALPGGRRRLSRGVRAALIAACLCAAVAGTAVAVSPGFQRTLDAWLGAFSPYTQEIESDSVVKNGVAFRVVSALADQTMLKVYVEARDLEGNRFTSDMDISGSVDRNPEGAAEGTMVTVRAVCVECDEQEQSALLEFSCWGSMPSDTTEAILTIRSLGGIDFRADGDEVEIPVSAATSEYRTFEMSGQSIDELEMDTLYVSALGIAAQGFGDSPLSISLAVTLYYEDGTAVQAKIGNGYGGGADGLWLTYWEFADPVELDRVTGISFDGEYVRPVPFGKWFLPLESDGTVGEGYWLSS